MTLKTNILTPSSYPVPTFTPERLRFLASSPTSPNLPTSTLITITGDGHCVLRLAGEICAYLTNYLQAEPPVSIPTSSKQEKKQKTKSANWLTEKLKTYPLLQDLDNVVFEEENDTISHFYERKARGKRSLLPTLISGLSPMTQTSSVLSSTQPTSTKHQPQQTTPPTVSPCYFRGQGDTTRGVIIILHLTHEDFLASASRDGHRLYSLWNANTTMR